MLPFASARYFEFCRQIAVQPLPLRRDNVLRLVAYLTEEGQSPTTIRVYLSGLCFIQVSAELPDPDISSVPWVHYLLWGVQRSQAPSANRHLPITPEVLQLLFTAWSSPASGDPHDRSMLWVACYLGFFGFMRSGEFTCPSITAFQDVMLSPRDVSVDSHDRASVVAIRLRRSKTDPFGRGVSIYLGRTAHQICPVSAMLGYMYSGAVLMDPSSSLRMALVCPGRAWSLLFG